MRIVKLVDRELKEAETQTIQRFQYYFEGAAQFVLIGDHVIVAPGGEKQTDIETLKKAARRAARNTLSRHPDFSAYRMDDGFGIVVMNKGSVIGISSQKLEEPGTEEQPVSMETAFSIRGEILEACSNLNLIALVVME